ncbi:hypothetical protein BUALT_Bualt02G0045000 [Buddleja alternifolia]|uniref:GATA-type domain-containing protein n=1 Tax=Buddleja alternifolia TaxID=168488 RepID=A0AAV6Y1N1_9LAMI|nr:hypothetical protein BUALT_Bualt02G0045000 [Buddleja alternifolia]
MREVGMRCKLKWWLIVGLLVLSVPVVIKASPEDDGYKKCEHTVEKWAASSVDTEVKHDKHALRDLLFFLHVPRTGGRTYFHCFLKKLFSNNQECPRSYDKLRFNPRKTNCRLLSTHDDYSMISKLPKEKTSVMTILRSPIDRVFSTYEFSVEVAARFLIHPNLTSVAKMARMAKRARKKTSGVSTLDIWPWKYLVPWMREDLFARRDTRKLRGQSQLETNNSYDMEDILMPLHEYIHEPIARDIVHNGATFQITGLTNNSYFGEAHEVRHCVQKYNNLGEYVLKVAKKRLDDMLYVGLTENHKESATIFANVVGAQVISQHTISNNASEQSSSLLDTTSDANDQVNNTDQQLNKVPSTGKDEAARGNMTVGKLMEAYETCISSLRNSQAERRVNSLKRISPANFTKEARRQVPESLIQEIASLNSLDVELYNYAQRIFKKQQAHMTTQSMVYSNVNMVEPGNSWDGVADSVVEDEEFDNILNLLDFPMESLDGDGYVDDWDSSKSQFLGPIPSNVLMGPPSLPCGKISTQPGPVTFIDGSPEQKPLPNDIKEASGSNIIQQNELIDVQESTVFQTQSPVSVLESSGSCSSGKTLPIKSSIPARPRSKRARPTGPNPWALLSPPLFATASSKKTPNVKKNREKRKNPLEKVENCLQISSDLQNGSSHRPGVTKKCTHCEITKTPQWREGPLGPKTLCNACGVRYRSGRLFPEYRPAASPTFVPSLHSNSHKKVVEMRNKGKRPMTKMEEPPISPQPEFVPMSSYLFDLMYN